MAIPNLSLSDGSASDGSELHDFYPSRSGIDFVEYRSQKLASDLIGQEKAQMSVRRGSEGGRNDRCFITLDVPILAEVAAGEGNSAGYVPPVLVDHRFLFKGEFILPKNLTYLNREKSAHLVSSLIATDEVKKALVGALILPMG